MMMKSVSIAVLAVLLVSCGESVKHDDSIDGPGGRDDDSSGQHDNTYGATSSGIGGDGVSGGTALGNGLHVSYEKNAPYDESNVLSQRIIYFDYDSNEVSEEYVELVKHHGKYLALNPSEKIRIESHADEQGTREYNIALSERRGKAVLELMQYEAAGADQLKVISFGEEKPVTFGNDEESLQLNRRVEIVYQ